MERTLDKHLDDTFRVPGVSGVICTDEHGLCLGAKGVASRESAGHVASIAESASRLMPNMPSPVICIEGDGGFPVPNTFGVICVDEHGLCIEAKGIARRESAGYVASIAKTAGRLMPNMPSPVICIEGEDSFRSILIKKEENVTIGIYKSIFKH